jgi:hypothetical protein
VPSILSTTVIFATVGKDAPLLLEIALGVVNLAAAVLVALQKETPDLSSRVWRRAERSDPDLFKGLRATLTMYSPLGSD